MGVRVYLADLRHNFSGVLANDCMPLGVAYMKAVIDRDLPGVSSRLFAYPDRLLAALDAEPPDVLMVSNYMWNEALSFALARQARLRRPDTLVVMGGPNIPLEPERQVAYVAAHPEIDVYALGEGDFLAAEIVRAYDAAGGSRERVRAEPLPSCVTRAPDGTLVRTEPHERHPRVDEIPSPWLSGCLDEFFDGKLAPLLETNRGCPFQCTFCVQGVRWYTKVHYFSTDRVRAEIDYIGARINAVCPSLGTLRIADSNYGMFDRDVELSTAIGEAQRRYGWPTYIDATTGKNRPERVIESLERVNGVLVLYQSVQSLDDETLRKIKRSNISKEAYDEVMIHVRGRGLRSLSDLILGLPSETLASHLASIDAILDSGTHEMHNFQAMMLKGSELETLASRERHRFETRFRVLPKNYGTYGGEPVFDVDEIVVATDTMTFEDYLEARTHHLACSIFWNNSWFEDVVALAGRLGVRPSTWLRAMRAAMCDDDGDVGRLVARFVGETQSELFPSPEACVDFYARPEHFERLVEGEIGDNLMYKYRALASFFWWPAVARLALAASRALLVERGARERIADFEVLWEDLARYVELKHAHGTRAEELLAPARAAFRYDIVAWLAAGLPLDASPFALRSPREFVFTLRPDGAGEIQAALRVWGTKLVGLTKGVTRLRATAQVRRCDLGAEPLADQRLGA